MTTTIRRKGIADAREATFVLIADVILLLVTSAPIAVALGLTSLVYFYYFTLIPMTQVSERLFNALNSFPLRWRFRSSSSRPTSCPAVESRGD